MKVYTYSEARQQRSVVLISHELKKSLYNVEAGNLFLLPSRKTKNHLLMFQALIRQQLPKTFLMQSKNQDQKVDDAEHVVGEDGKRAASQLGVGQQYRGTGNS
jgi:hypothetical protein